MFRCRLPSFQLMSGSEGLKKQTKKKKPKLTVVTSVGLQSESNPTVGIPVQGDQADVASDHRVLELVLDHTVCVGVTWKCL